MGKPGKAIAFPKWCYISLQRNSRNGVPLNFYLLIKMTRYMTTKQFSFYHSPVWNKTPERSVTLEDVYHYVTGPQAAERTSRLRSIADASAARKYKTEAFDYVTFSGVFNHCSDDALVSHSQLLCLDFDHVPDVEALKLTLMADTLLTTRLLFTSPSGDGVKWVVEIDTARAAHREWFRSIGNYLASRYHLESDAKCANESRACFLPYDPDCMLNL